MNHTAREAIQFSPKESRRILFGDSDEYVVVADDIISFGRWTLNHRLVIKRLSDNKYFAARYSHGSSELVKERPFEFGGFFEQVFPKQETITTYL